MEHDKGSNDFEKQQFIIEAEGFDAMQAEDVMAGDEASLVLAEEIPDYAFSLIFSQESDKIIDQLLGYLVFAYALLQRNEFDKNPHFVGLVTILIALYFVFVWVRARISEFRDDSKNFRRVELIKVLAKFLFLAITYVSAIMIRMIVDELNKGPTRGHWNVLGLIRPVCIFLIVFTIIRVVHFVGDVRKEFMLNHLIRVPNT